MQQKILKVQKLDTGFLVYTTDNGRVSKSAKVSLDEVLDVVKELFTEKPKEEKT